MSDLKKPEKCPSNNPKDIEFYVRGWNNGQEELMQAIHRWGTTYPVNEQPEIFRSLLSAMEHS